METIIKRDYKSIPGWGIDMDPKNEPTYPMKNYTGVDHNRIRWVRPTLQDVNEEILKSNEHARVPAVFGTATPPRGLSGKIRRWAFKYSENAFFHWLPLILADRVDMVEGVVEDFQKGYVPNFLAERGWNAEWKYNRKAAVTKIAAGVLLTAAVAGLIYLKVNKKKDVKLFS